MYIQAIAKNINYHFIILKTLRREFNLFYANKFYTQIYL